MKVEQIYTGCLAEAAYYIESEGEVAIIDPLRDVEPYIEMAEANGARIKYVLETHFHADFVSGHLDLARKTGALIVYGPTAQPNFPAYVASNNEVLELGNIQIKILHTPGHTLESTSYLLMDEKGNEHAIFTGDTLFLGDVGRPDLAIKQGEITEKDLAGMLYDSLRNQIMPLGDKVIVYPGHGAGSACGKRMSKDTWDLLGNQKQVNYALRAKMSKEEFVEEVLTGLVSPPQYFPKNAQLNKHGYDSIDLVRERGMRPLDLREFQLAMEEENILVLDTRHQDVFCKGFIPGSIFIGIDDNFAMWVGALITDLDQPILFIADPGREEEVVNRLARVGYDHAIGYLSGGFKTWLSAGLEIDLLEEIEVNQFAQVFTPSMKLLDVRKASEFNAEHLIGARSFPLDTINQKMFQLDRDQSYYLHCAGGYRSVIAASILKARGYDQLINIRGGYRALCNTPLQRSEFQMQFTEL